MRYHLRKPFARLGATSRDEAVRRARETGLIPDGGVQRLRDAAGGQAGDSQRSE